MNRFRDIVFGSGEHEQNVLSAAETTVNYYVETLGPSDAQAQALWPTPGFTALVTHGSATGTRAAWGGVISRTFFVIGAKFVELTFPAGVATLTDRGTVAADGNRAYIAYNGSVGNQLFVASASNGYSYDLGTNTLTLQLTGEAHQIGMISGYFLAFNKTLGKLRVSGLDDATTWDPTQFALRSAQPDPWIGMEVNSPDIWLFGSESSDIWTNKVLGSMPISPRVGLTIPYGIAAADSAYAIGGAVIWLARNSAGAGIFVMSQGYNPRPITVSGVDIFVTSLRRGSTIDDAEAMVYQQNGHTFYVCRFPTADMTIAYDLKTDRWARRGKMVSSTLHMWTPRVHCDAAGKHLIGDATGNISSMDGLIGSELDGAAIYRKRTSSVLIRGLNPIPISKLTLVLEIENGSSSSVVPAITLKTSRDGGSTFGSAMTPSVAPTSEYLKRLTWTRLGTPRSFVAEFTSSDLFNWRIVDAYINDEASQ